MGGCCRRRWWCRWLLLFLFLLLRWPSNRRLQPKGKPKIDLFRLAAPNIINIAPLVIALDSGLYRKKPRDKDDARTLLRVAAFAAALLDLDETLALAGLRFGTVDRHHGIHTGIHEREAAVVPGSTRRTAMRSEGELRWLSARVIGVHRERISPQCVFSTATKCPSDPIEGPGYCELHLFLLG